MFSAWGFDQLDQYGFDQNSFAWLACMVAESTRAEKPGYHLPNGSFFPSRPSCSVAWLVTVTRCILVSCSGCVEMVKWCAASSPCVA